MSEEIIKIKSTKVKSTKTKQPKAKPIKSTYADGRIFKLIDNTTGNVFINGTIRDLCQRIANYKSKYTSYLKNPNSKYLIEFEILKNNNYSIELIKMTPSKNKDELNKEIYKAISENECINKNRNIMQNVNDLNFDHEFEKIFTEKTNTNIEIIENEIIENETI
jgi:hypothetical protein